MQREESALCRIKVILASRWVQSFVDREKSISNLAIASTVNSWTGEEIIARRSGRTRKGNRADT